MRQKEVMLSIDCASSLMADDQYGKSRYGYGIKKHV